MSGADDLSICLPVTPGGGCFEPTYARSYVTASIDGLIGQSFLHGAYGVVGVGRASLHGGPISQTTQQLPRSRSLIRLGLGAQLGRSRHAPRLEVVSAEFARAAGSAKRLLSIGVWLK